MKFFGVPGTLPMREKKLKRKKLEKALGRIIKKPGIIIIIP